MNSNEMTLALVKAAESVLSDKDDGMKIPAYMYHDGVFYKYNGNEYIEYSQYLEPEPFYLTMFKELASGKYRHEA